MIQKGEYMNYFKKKRLSLNKTQYQMCKEIGIGHNTYVKLEVCKNYKPGIKTIEALSKYFNLSPDDIRSLL